MADLLIRGMEMPHDCDECKLCAFIPVGEYGLYRKCMPLNRNAEITMRRKDCPLHELPEHGDLIDLDERVTKQVYNEYNMEWDMKTKTVRQWLNIDVADTPVIIPASKEETE